MFCIECGNEAVVYYCELKALTKENFHRVFSEGIDLRGYCEIHLPNNLISLKLRYALSTVSDLPDEFVHNIERDLNKMTNILPDYLKEKYEEITKNRNYEHLFEFLIGWCIGTCESSYFQVYQHKYGKIISDTQITEIRKIVSRRRIQIEQGISAFLKENNVRV